jgi:hypothetical protein
MTNSIKTDFRADFELFTCGDAGKKILYGIILVIGIQNQGMCGCT